MKRKMYFCDPLLNKNCGKQMCFVRGGDCYMTSHEEYSQKYDIPRRQALRCLEDVLYFTNKDEEDYCDEDNR